MRRIPLSGRSHVTGFQPTLTGTTEHESALERDFVTLCTVADPAAEITAQPVTTPLHRGQFRSALYTRLPGALGRRASRVGGGKISRRLARRLNEAEAGLRGCPELGRPAQCSVPDRNRAGHPGTKARECQTAAATSHGAERRGDGGTRRRAGPVAIALSATTPPPG
jgi:hypothetical protein